MKLGYMMLLVAVGAMLVIAPSAMAADKPAKGHGDKNVAYGKVTAVDATANTITIAPMAKKDAPAAEPKVITTNKDTKVVVGDKDGTIADVTVGARVAVTTTEDGKTAVKIAVMPAREKKK